MRSIELFAGAGGLGLGLHAAGFRPVDVIEWDPWCCDTLRENRAAGVRGLSSWSITEADVREIDFSVHEDRLDLVSGGPPCQPFSLGGKHKAHADARDMFPDAIRAVREIRPRAFVFENVKGLTRPTFRTYFEYIRLQLQYPEITLRGGEDWARHLSRLERHHTSGSTSGLHYRVVSRVLNAADFGVPQRRERVVFVGFRYDLGVEWSFPSPTHSRAVLAKDQLNGDYWERHRVPRKSRGVSKSKLSLQREAASAGPELAWRTVRDALSDIPDPERHPLLADAWCDHRFQPGARSYPGHTGSPLDEPAKTLKAGVHGVPGGENMLLRPNGSVRYFTVRECARLQSFPDDFKFHGSWSETMRQLGNAVPVELARAVGEGVARAMPASRRPSKRRH